MRYEIKNIRMGFPGREQIIYADLYLGQELNSHADLGYLLDKVRRNGYNVDNWIEVVDKVYNLYAEATLQRRMNDSSPIST